MESQESCKGRVEEVAMTASFRAKVWGTLCASIPFQFFCFPIRKVERSSNLFRSAVRLLRSFFTHFVSFEASVFRFVHAHFEPLLYDLVLCSKVALSALNILFDHPYKSNAGSIRQLQLHSFAIATSYRQFRLPQCLFTVSAL